MARTGRSSNKPPDTPQSSDTSFQNPRGELHRIGIAREQQGLSLRTVARRMRKSIAEVKDQEQSSSDLHLSTLYLWCEVLNVPIEELLVEPKESFSTPVLKRTQMIKLIKMAMTIGAAAESDAVRRLADTMVELLIEIMPELQHIKSTLGSTGPACRGRVGRVAENTIADSFFEESP